MDFGTTLNFIASCQPIHDYYGNYLEYQTGSREALPKYEKNILLLPLNNEFLKLFNVWFLSDLDFNFISTIQ